MKIKLDFSAIMALIHLTFVLSLVCFGTVFLTLGILAIPAWTAAFSIGKDVIYRRFDINDGLVKRFFSEMRSEMRMMKYFPLQLLIMMQAAGIYAAERTGMTFLMYPMLICVAFCLTLIVYIIACHIFYQENPSIINVIITMLYRIQYFLIVWILMLLAVLFFGTVMMGVLLIAGTILLLAVEVVTFLGIVSFKKLRNELTDEEKEYFNDELLSKL